jgi:hypothetical protein
VKTFIHFFICAIVLLIAPMAHTQTIIVTEQVSKDGVYFRESNLSYDYYYCLGKLSKKKMMDLISFQDERLSKRNYVNQDTVMLNLVDSSLDGWIAIMDIRMKQLETDCKIGKVDSNYTRLVQTVLISSTSDQMKVLATIDSLSVGDVSALKAMFENMGNASINSSNSEYTLGETYKFPVNISTNDNAGTTMNLDELLTKKLVKIEDENLVFDCVFKAYNTSEDTQTNCKTDQHSEGDGIETIEISTGIKSSEMFKTEFVNMECNGNTGTHIFLKDEIIKEGFRSFAKK